eukprot:CAMPEP_0113406140 /NCGR_PEP_ID=MMETSP0013_2-20120614/19340_1 /TAXON_ID=2843 ORGANISM="Skeletonema costatum, Strain 1716" /NCGR_SAMPLE_ID=MMETSP0013_2 /ASSEMBLY_ACC=CAM_ASM_000158 /LENGTH=192 /DNA_ID=CAMNT_0000291941 /DNA_START=435 /DNA_END=1013 /DNA_ORIENTATION=- /assembly_acc=CAM_ASM_000158
MIRELEGSLEHRCEFCRRSVEISGEERERNMMKRIEASDREAMCEMGTRRCGEGDYSAAFDYWTRAAALGDIHAHFELSILYRDGRVVEKDDKKQLHHLEVAAIGGDVSARNNLGLFEEKTGRTDRAVKHYIIAAKLGCDNSLDALMLCYRDGLVSKEDFAGALRGHQAAIDAMKSPQREAAEEYKAGVNKC